MGPRTLKLPYETAIHLAGLHFKHPEIHEAVKKSAAWVAYLDANPDFGRDDDDFEELCPWEANRSGHDFARWYAMKKSGFRATQPNLASV
ncbi:hypothetical protein QW131_15445 [Roseibium salinum]|nr:hypothetical protein [Roseibium salinum]